METLFNLYNRYTSIQNRYHSFLLKQNINDVLIYLCADFFDSFPQIASVHFELFESEGEYSADFLILENQVGAFINSYNIAAHFNPDSRYKMSLPTVQFVDEHFAFFHLAQDIAVKQINFIQAWLYGNIDYLIQKLGVGDVVIRRDMINFIPDGTAPEQVEPAPAEIVDGPPAWLFEGIELTPTGPPEIIAVAEGFVLP